jgi:hypothetical protein
MTNRARAGQAGGRAWRPTIINTLLLSMAMVSVVGCGGGGGGSASPPAPATQQDGPRTGNATGYWTFDTKNFFYYNYYAPNSGLSFDERWRAKDTVPLSGWDSLHTLITPTGNGLYTLLDLDYEPNYYLKNDFRAAVFRVDAAGKLQVVKEVSHPIPYQVYEYDRTYTQFVARIHSATVSPDMAHFAYAVTEPQPGPGVMGSTKNVYVSDGAGAPVLVLLEAGGPVWLDANRLLVTRPGGFTVLDLAARTLSPLGAEGLGAGLATAWPAQAVLSPDGRSIAYLHGVEDESIWVMNLAAQSFKQITNGTSHETHSPLSWSPDGQYVGTLTGCDISDNIGVHPTLKGPHLIPVDKERQAIDIEASWIHTANCHRGYLLLNKQ